MLRVAFKTCADQASVKGSDKFLADSLLLASRR
jgi:hypothetical protein